MSVVVAGNGALMSKTPLKIRALLFPLLAGLISGLTGCTSVSLPQGTPPGAGFDHVSSWHGEGMSGSPSIRISLSRQRAYFYKGGKLAGVSLISSGREGLDTVTGNFKILEKDREHRSSVFGNYLNADGEVIQKDVNTRLHPLPPGAHYEGANMPNWMRITGGTGMHAGYLPGYPASHGCIRMPAFMAEAFFNSISVGTPVSIEP